MNKPKSILMVYGPGGHKEQAKRLLKLKKSDAIIIELSEKGIAPISNSNVIYKTLPFENKYKANHFRIMISLFYLVFLTVKIFILHNPKKVVSTGPIIGIVPIVMSWITGKESVFIESWSRFYEPSTTGKILTFFAKKIYIQNHELKKHYPSGIFSGRL